MDATCRPSAATIAPALDLTPVEAALDRLRPFLRRDGGDIQVVGLAGRRLQLRLLGSLATHHLALRQISADVEGYLLDQVPGLDGIDLT